MNTTLIPALFALAALGGCATTTTVSTAPPSTVLEAAIDGPGFFTLEGAGGRPLYTRDGRFTLDGAHELVSVASGRPVMPRIVVPCEATILHIEPDGRVLAWTGAGEEPVEIGTLELVVFENPERLTAMGGGVYAEAWDAPADFALVPVDGAAGRVVSGAMFPGASPTVLTDAGEDR